MSGVSFQGDRAVDPGGAAQAQRHSEVDERGEHGDDEADADRLDRPRVQEPVARGVADRASREENEATLRAAGKILRLLVAVGVLLVRLARRHGEGDQRDDRRHEVDDRFQGVGEETDRAGQGVGPGLHRDRHQGSGNREPGEARAGG